MPRFGGIRHGFRKDPVAGDAEESQKISPYPYGNGNPVSFIDPEGESGVIVGSILLGTLVVTKFGPWVMIALSDNEDVKEIGRDIRPGGGTSNIGIHSYELQEEIYLGSLDNIERKRPIMHAADYYDDKNSSFSEIRSLETHVTPRNQKPTSTPDEVRAKKALLNPTDHDSIDAKRIKPRMSKRYLDSIRYARRGFARQFSKLRSASFLDNQTRSFIELSIEREIYSFSSKRYGWRTSTQKRRKKEELARDINSSAARLYSRLTSALSKYSVLVRGLDRLPSFNQGMAGRSGVYAGN